MTFSVPGHGLPVSAPCTQIFTIAFGPESVNASKKLSGTFVKTYDPVSGKAAPLPIPTLAFSVQPHEKWVLAFGVWAPYAPVVTVSAKTRESIGSIMPTALEVVGQRRIKMPPNELNKLIREASQEHPAPSFKGRRLKIVYATQASDETPTVVLFVNDTGLLHFSYRRYLENKIRERFSLAGNPLKLVLRSEEGRPSALRGTRAGSRTTAGHGRRQGPTRR